MTSEPQPTTSLSNHERLRAAYRNCRAAGHWPTTRSGNLSAAGRQQAFWFIQGWKFSAGEQDDTTLWLCQVRGPDFAMGLTDTGTERTQESPTND